MVITGAEITAWVGAYFWPLVRIGGMVMTAPVFGSKPIPFRIRLVIALAITAVVVPVVAPQVPVVDALSPLAMLIVAQQLLIGVVMGFAFQLVISAVITGGQTIAMQMGLGFAVMVDPQNGSQAPVLSQFYVLLVLLVFVLMNGHLLLIEIMADSFRTIPIGAEGLKPDDIWQLLSWGSMIFAGALSMALPAIASLLLVNITFGIMTRASPQLNIFAIGFPVTMMVGFAVVFATLPSIIPNSTELFNQTYHLVQQLFKTGGP